MSITSLPSTSLFNYLDTSATSQSNSTSSGGVSGSSQLAGSSDSSQLSVLGKLLSELKYLSERNPAEFKKITAEIAKQLQSAAGNTADSQESELLNTVASSFAQSSQSGSFSDLLPHKPGSIGKNGSAINGYGSNPSGAEDVLRQIFSKASSQIQTAMGTFASITLL